MPLLYLTKDPAAALPNDWRDPSSFPGAGPGAISGRLGQGTQLLTATTPGGGYISLAGGNLDPAAGQVTPGNFYSMRLGFNVFNPGPIATDVTFRPTIDGAAFTNLAGDIFQIDVANGSLPAGVSLNGFVFFTFALVSPTDFIAQVAYGSSDHVGGTILLPPYTPGGGAYAAPLGSVSPAVFLELHTTMPLCVMEYRGLQLEVSNLTLFSGFL